MNPDRKKLVPLLVDIHPPPDPEPSLQEVLLEACSQTAPTPCAARPPGAAEKPHAIVRFSSEYSRVELWVLGPDGNSYRSLNFSEHDEQKDRVTAAGVLLGALMRKSQEQVAQPPAREPESPPREEAAPTDKAREPQEEDQGEPMRGYVQPSLGGSSGLGFRLTGRLEAGFWLSSWVGVYGGAMVGVEPQSFRGIRFSTTEASAGFIGSSGGERFFGEIAVGPRWQRLRGTLSSEGSTETATTSRWGLEASWGGGLYLSSKTALELEGTSSWFAERPTIAIAGIEQSRVPAWELGARLGLRLLF